MRVIIFNDKDNFDGSINKLNGRFEKGKKRFWRIEKCHSFLFKKLSEVFSWKDGELKLLRSYIYTGEYNADIIKKHKRHCKKQIKETERFIKMEEELINGVDTSNLSNELKEKLKNHSNTLKEIFKDKKTFLERNISKQKRNFNGQKGLFERLDKMSFTEYKTTPLKHAKGTIYQKGVDVKIATDLIQLANTNAYDVALILGGDTDLIESIKLIKDCLGKIVIVVAYYDNENPLNSTISKDVILVADYFINLNDLTNEDVEKVSELRRIKT